MWLLPSNVAQLSQTIFFWSGILNQRSNTIQHAQYKVHKVIIQFVFHTETLTLVVWYPTAIIYLRAPCFESFWYILVWAALATKLLDKYICSAAHYPQMGIKARLAILKMTAALHHEQLALDEQCWHSFSESEEESKLSAVKVAYIFYTRAWPHICSERKMAAANEQSVSVELWGQLVLFSFSDCLILHLWGSVLAEVVIIQHLCWRKQWRTMTRTLSQSLSVLLFLSTQQTV